MKLHHLQRRGCKPETKKNPVIKLELLEVVPWTSDDPKGAFGKDHLLPNLCAWMLLPFPQTLPLSARLTSPLQLRSPAHVYCESKGRAPGKRIFTTTPGSLQTPL